MIDLQAWLDEVADAVRARDFARFRSHMSLPFTVITVEGTSVMTTTGQLRRSFDAYLHALERFGVTDYVRTAQSVHQVGPQLATGVYRTHLIRNGVRVVEFETAGTLRLSEAGWQGTSTTSSIPNAVHWLSLPPYLAPEVALPGAEAALDP